MIWASGGEGLGEGEGIEDFSEEMLLFYLKTNQH